MGDRRSGSRNPWRRRSALFELGKVRLQLLLLPSDVKTLPPGAIQNRDARHQEQNGCPSRLAVGVVEKLVLEAAEQALVIAKTDDVGEVLELAGVLRVRSKGDSHVGE